MTTPARSHPLDWPDGWARSKRRKQAAYKIVPGKAMKELAAELRRFGARHIVVSSNMPLKADGLPYAEALTQHYDDPGIAVYFTVRRNGEDHQHVFACDRWRKAWQNVRAIGLTIAAFRQIERSGAVELLNRAFQGFKALPPAEKPRRPWWEVLGLERNSCTLDVAEAVGKARAKEHHPDVGGDEEKFKELQDALEDARKDLNR